MRDIVVKILQQMQKSSLRDVALYEHHSLGRGFELAAAPQSENCDGRFADQTDSILNLNDVRYGRG
jgi:hypothetical protein